MVQDFFNNLDLHGTYQYLTDLLEGKHPTTDKEKAAFWNLHNDVIQTGLELDREVMQEAQETREAETEETEEVEWTEADITAYKEAEAEEAETEEAVKLSPEQASKYQNFYMPAPLSQAFHPPMTM